MSSDFWSKKGIAPQATAQDYAEASAQIMGLDEEAMEALQEDPNVDIFDEEEENTQELMSDVNLRLEQGRLYQMILQGDIFANTNADPKAIRNVQRQVHKFVREQMEIMVGIRQEQPMQTVVSSPFNDLEVSALKMVASKVTKGASEESKPAPVLQVPAIPKKDGITSISGSLRPQAVAPLKANPKPVQKAQAKPAPKPLAKSAIKPEESLLTKSIDDMTPEELSAHNKVAEERSKRNYATLPTNMVPHPNAQQLEALYTVAAANTSIANPWRSIE
jgi:hypothetical protein